MARGRSTGLGWAIASVIMGILFVFSLLFAIIFYTKISAANEQAEQAQSQLRQYVRGNEQAAAGQLETGGDSVFGHLTGVNDDLKRMIVGVSDVTMDEVRTSVNQLGIDSSEGLVKAVRQSAAEKRSDQQLISQLESARDKAQNELKAAQQEKTQVTRTFNQSVEQLKRELAQEQQTFSSYQSDVTSQQQQIESRLEEVRSEAGDRVTTMQSRTEELEKEIERLNMVISELREKLGGDRTAEVDQSTQVDGEIAAVLSADNLVLLTLGREEQVVLGMTFEVYDANAVIEADATGRVRGKATVEVVSISDRSSTARVVRTGPNASVTEGDVLVNAAYDPNQTYKFYVFGEFDLDGTGEATVTGRRRVESLVTSWGANVVPELTYDTDFLLLGQEPVKPEPLQAGETDPVKIARFTRAKQVREQYESLIAEAKSLSIPILNQNRFLSLLGYYQR